MMEGGVVRVVMMEGGVVRVVTTERGVCLDDGNSR